MKSFAFFILSMLIPTFLFSQETSDLVTLKWGESKNYNTGKNLSKHQFNEKYIIVTEDKLTLQITKYDAQYNLIKKNEISIEHELVKGKVYYEEIFEINERFWAVSKIKNKAQLKFHFVIQELDFENLSFIGKPKEILSINFLRKGYYEHLTFRYNKNSDLFMVTFYNSVTNSDKQITEYQHIARLYNSDWEILDEKEQSLSTADFNNLYNGYMLTKSDKIIAFRSSNLEGYIDEDDIYELDTKGKYQLITSELKTDFEKQLYLRRSMNAEHFLDYKAIEKKNIVTLMGEYNSDGGDSAQGIAFKTIDFNNNKKESIIFNEFEEEDEKPLQPLFDPNSAKFINGDFYSVDNGYYYITHKMAYSPYTYTDVNGHPKSGIFGIMDGIYIFHYDNSGTQDWMKKIPFLKILPNGILRYSTDFNYSISEGIIYIIYDGYDPQVEIKSDKVKMEKMFYPKKKLLMCAVVQPNGNVSVDKIFKEVDSKFNDKLSIKYRMKYLPAFKIEDRKKSDMGFIIFKEP